MDGMKKNIEGLKILIEILGKLPTHRTDRFEYGTSLWSDFVYGNFCFLDKPIPINKYRWAMSRLSQFYQGKEYQIYTIEENKLFLLWIKFQTQNHIYEEPAMGCVTSQLSIRSGEEMSVSRYTYEKAKLLDQDINSLTDLLIERYPHCTRKKTREYVFLLLRTPGVTFWISRSKDDGSPTGVRMILSYPGGIQGYCNYVKPSHRRHGIATQLLQAVIRGGGSGEGKERSVVWFTNQTTEAGSKFSEKIGMTKVGTYMYCYL